MTSTLFSILVFPGLLFLSLFSTLAEFLDRRLYARFQNRQGPPWFQPVADFIKLFAKEDIIPEEAEPFMFRLLPVLALTATITAFFYIPLWNVSAMLSFDNDIIVVIYLLTIPTLTFFLGGWYSTSLYSVIGAVRSLTQLFAYEVPLFMAVLAPALIADTWSLKGMISFYQAHPGYWLFNLIGFLVAVIAVQGKLEKVPFDIPEAETEIVAGAFTEYSGRLLAIFRMAIDIEMVVCASLLAAVFLPFGYGLSSPALGFAVYIAKMIGVITVMAFIRSIFARLRIDQMVRFCWKFLAPAALVQLVISLIVKAFLLS